jgi:hypothetical protein
MLQRKQVPILGATVLLLVVTSVTAQAATPVPTATKNPYGANQQIDPPGPTDILLTVTNHGRVVKLNMKALRKLGTNKISVYEPFVKVRQTFTVVPLIKILELVNIPSSANLITDALNDYIYTNTAANFTASNGQLAIERFGKPIPYDQGGPIRIIFPDKTPLAQNLNAWNWSLDIIKVK